MGPPIDLLQVEAVRFVEDADLVRLEPTALDGRVPAELQAPQGARDNVAAHLGFKPEQVTLNVTLLGGGFGDMADNDRAHGRRTAEIGRVGGKADDFCRTIVRQHEGTRAGGVGVEPGIAPVVALDMLLAIVLCGLATFAVDKGLGRVSMWSLNRDARCRGTFTNVVVHSNTCSGVAQDALAFSSVFAGLPGSAVGSSGRDSVAIADQANACVVAVSISCCEMATSHGKPVNIQPRTHSVTPHRSGINSSRRSVAAGEKVTPCGSTR